MWVNKVESIYQDILDQAEQFMKQFEAGQLEGRLGPLKAALNRTVQLAQLIEGFELEPSEAELRGVSRELVNSKAKMQAIACPLMRSESKANELVQEAE